jgi:hypothetical protein
VDGATEFTCQNGKILKVWELGDLKSLKVSCSPCSEDERRKVVYWTVPFIVHKID